MESNEYVETVVAKQHAQSVCWNTFWLVNV